MNLRKNNSKLKKLMIIHILNLITKKNMDIKRLTIKY